MTTTSSSLSWIFVTLTFLSTVSSFELPKFGKGFDLKLIPEDVKQGFEKLGEFTNISLITSLLDQFKLDYIPDLNEMQKDSVNSCVQFGKNVAKRVIPAKFKCLKEVPKQLMAKARRHQRDVLPPCFGKCVGMELTILDPDGTPNLINARKLIDEIVPKMFMEFVGRVLEKCGDTISAIKADDPKCETHRAAMKCVTDSISEFSMEALKMCPDIPDGWKRLIKSVSDSANE